MSNVITIGAKDGDVHVDGTAMTPVQAIMLARIVRSIPPDGVEFSKKLTLAAAIASEQRSQALAIIANAGERMAKQERSKFN